MVEWSNSDNYHQRRLASEGLRPKLPWATALLFDYREAIPVLDNLYADPTRYVTRSVANHLNDIAKDDPKLVIKTLKRWKESKKQTETEMNFIIKHSLRTLIKRGHQGSLELMGYNINPKITVKNFVIQKKKISLGKKLSFSCDIISENTASEGLIIDYRITYATKTKRASNKVFKMKQFILAPNETKRVKKDHLFKKMSTKSLHTGTHGIALIINGKEMARDTFYLKV